ncbi:adenine deaminase [Siminovitchia sp. FSL H7-0308]|uniref:Adenine deaminase n=1 Tax=Siminovitchia thermophila TaxID=1245522 RepID=A0ABS2RC61_9BACI|nr:adenine deaminase [Siminovitchia thermophila]MBM7716176.1 adenine deaminase [Siminovitchia thermophila]ONK21476.1 adenine deaminase [Bacillus sp. VT-16-64]
MNHSREAIVAAARGDKQMDLVIRSVQLINVFTAEIYRADIGIKSDRFAAVARYEAGRPQFWMEGKKEVHADGLYAMPGFIDSHVHIESTMVPPDMFARAVLRHGTTVAVVDPHEIANVMGVEGVKYMVEASRGLPVHILTTIPSCVPAVPGVETAGAEFKAEDISELLSLPNVVGVAEIMDYPGVIHQHPRMAQIVQAGLEKNVLNEGHAPRVTGRQLQAYLAAGVNSDHECRSDDEVLEKLRSGMMVYIRESSVSKFADVAAKAWQTVPHALNIAMCTDDIEPNDMLQNGQMNRVVRRAIEEGIPAPLAIRYATLGGAIRFGLKERGAIAAGRLADLVLVESLETMDVCDVYVGGKQFVSEGELTTDITSSIPPLLKNTVRLPQLSEDDFVIHAPIRQGSVTLTTMEVTSNGTTVQGTVEAEVHEGKVRTLPPDHIFVSVTGRHGQGKKPFVGVLKGAGLKDGAYATTVAHDSHNLVVVGTNAADMLLAARSLEACGGGLCLVRGKEVIAKVELPVAGLMAPEPVEQLAPKVGYFSKKALEMGIAVGRRAPAMALSSLALTVTPHIRITDKGLIDVEQQKLIPLIQSS